MSRAEFDQAAAYARSLGYAVNVERDPDGRALWIEAPAGHVFAGYGVHEVMAYGSDEAHRWSWRDAAARLQKFLDVEPCGQRPHCEWCDGE